MDKYTTKSTINKLFEVLDEQKFLNVINVSNIDHYIKKLAAYKFLELLIIAQLNEAESLRDLSKQLKDNQGVQQAIEMDTISTSQLSRKQCDLPPFEKVFRHLVFEVQAQMKNKSIVRDIGKLLVIDSSTVSMSLSQFLRCLTKQKKFYATLLKLKVAIYGQSVESFNVRKIGY